MFCNVPISVGRRYKELGGGQQVRIGHGQCQRRSAFLHPGDVIIQTINSCLAITPAISFEAFEAGTCVVKNVRRRVHRQWLQWLDRRLLPGTILITDDRDMIAKFCAKLAHFLISIKTF
jgi:hypothetical protein